GSPESRGPVPGLLIGGTTTSNPANSLSSIGSVDNRVSVGRQLVHAMDVFPPRVRLVEPVSTRRRALLHGGVLVEAVVFQVVKLSFGGPDAGHVRRLVDQGPNLMLLVCEEEVEAQVNGPAVVLHETAPVAMRPIHKGFNDKQFRPGIGQGVAHLRDD